MVPEPLVSIVTCFYNEEKFLNEAIESVLAQQYKNWEYLLVDDGSTDRSAEIAKMYAEKYSGKIFLLHHEGQQNKGLSPSRNLGIQHSRGEFICFLDADDVYLENKLVSQVPLMQKYKAADLLIEATEYWYSWEKGAQEDVIIEVGFPEGLHQPPSLIHALYPLGKGQSPCTSSYMLRRSSVAVIGGFEDSFTGRLILYEDQAFLCKYYLLGQVYISSECNSRYRQRSDSSMHKVITEGHYSNVRRSFFRYLQQFIRDRAPGQIELVRRIQTEILRTGPVANAIRKLFRRLRP